MVIAELERSFWEADGVAVASGAALEVPLSRPIGVIADQSVTFSSLFRSFLADPTKVRAPKTQMIYDGLYWIASSVWGRDRPITSIDRSACRELLDVLRYLPSNPHKRFPDLNAVQAAKMARASGLKSTLSPGSINGYMAKLRALLTFAVNEGWIDRNPALGLNVSDPVRERDKRLPFSAPQLQAIFNAPIYRGCLDDEGQYATPGPNHPRRARFWIPLIALFSGMRLNEICQLDVADIQTLDGVACFHIRPDSDASGGKRLKTKTSERIVPVHPVLLDCAFSEYVERRRRQNGDKLFPELRPSGTGYYSDAFSKWFRRFLGSAGAERPRTCFHSFRHNFRDALRDGGVVHEVGLSLGGWAGAPGGEAVSESYGAGFSSQRLYDAISAVRYQGLDLDHIKGG